MNVHPSSGPGGNLGAAFLCLWALMPFCMWRKGRYRRHINLRDRQTVWDCHPASFSACCSIASAAASSKCVTAPEETSSIHSNSQSNVSGLA